MLRALNSTGNIDVTVRDGLRFDSPALFSSELLSLEGDFLFPTIITSENSITITLDTEREYSSRDRFLYLELVSTDRGTVLTHVNTPSPPIEVPYSLM